MSKCDIVNSVNKIKWLFREYDALRFFLMSVHFSEMKIDTQ